MKDIQAQLEKLKNYATVIIVLAHNQEKFALYLVANFFILHFSHCLDVEVDL